MEANLAAPVVDRPPEEGFPYANWGPGAALLGVVMAIGVGIMLGLPAVFFGTDDDGDLSTTGTIVAQLGTALGFLLVPMAIVSVRGAGSMREILRRLGVRGFEASAFKWMASAVGAYLLFAMLYSLIVGVPEQDDIAESFGPVATQILLIVVAASIAEEVLFRGYLFGGLREKLPRIAAALVSGAVFGSLHALTGISAVPPLIAFGVILALLYEKTGSIVPAIILHMLNNSVALLAQ